MPCPDITVDHFAVYPPKQSITVPGESTDTSTSLVLFGKGYQNWGEALNENFLHLLENFASEENPGMPGTPMLIPDPVEGQLWFNIDDDNIYFFGQGWIKLLAEGSGSSLDDMGDVSAAGANPGDALVWDGVKWIPGTLAVSSLSDVDLAGLSTDDILIWDGAKWVPLNFVLGSIKDVDLTGLNTDDILRWKGTNWEPESLVVDALDDVDTTGVAAGDVLRWNGVDTWTPDTLELNDLSDVDTTGVVENDILVKKGSGWVPQANVLPAGIGPLPFAGPEGAIPPGFLLCDGSEVSRTTYGLLFAVIGTTYGIGNGSSTFNLPDLRGRIVVGKDDMGGTPANVITDPSADVLGGTFGEEEHALTDSEMPIHTHTGSTNSAGNHTHGSASAGSGYQFLSMGPSGSSAGEHYIDICPDDPCPHPCCAGANRDPATGSGGSHSHSMSLDNAGGGVAHNNVQPAIALNYIISAGEVI